MLVLTRKVGEKILIPLPSGETIEIVTVRVGAHDARIGIDAPKHIRVCREETIRKKQKDKQ